jgi:hypothetical protein
MRHTARNFGLAEFVSTFQARVTSSREGIQRTALTRRGNPLPDARKYSTSPLQPIPARLRSAGMPRLPTHYPSFVRRTP